MTHIIDTIPSLSPYFLAQTSEFSKPVWEEIISDAGTSLLAFGKALLLLLLGYIVAVLVKGLIRGILNRTNIDNRIAAWISGQQGGESFPIEEWIGNLAFWIIFLFAIIAFLDALNLDAVSGPLNSLLTQVTAFLPKILGAAFLLGLAWLLASLTKIIVIRGLGALNLDERLNRQMGESTTEELSLTNTIANALYWFIFLLFLPSILSTLQLQGTLDPVQTLLDEILAIIPNVIGAVLIGAVGWLIAQIIRRLVTNLLAATGVDQFGAKLGLSTAVGRQSLSWIIGTITYVLVLIPVAIAALNALQIQAISLPAINMLNQVLNLLPKLFAATIILVLAYIAGKYIAELITNILSGIGFDNLFNWLGFSLPTPPPATPPTPEEAATGEQPTVLQAGGISRTPSELAGIVVLVAIMLVATLTAVDILQIEALQSVVGVILVIAGQVLIGLVVFAIGLYLANLAFNLIASSGSRQAKILGQTARIAIITLVSAMALQQMGIAPNIVNLAFGLLLGGIAVAIALAFGLGGRDVAGEQLREWLDSFKKQ